MMCRGDPDRQSQLVTYGGMKNVLADPTHSPFGGGAPGFHGTVNPAALAEYQRLQLYDYAQAAAANRLRFTHPAFMTSPYGLAFPPITDGQTGLTAYGLSPFMRFDPRARFVQEEPKPQHSYIGLIAMAILSCPDKKMVLSDIYQYILDQYPYFRNRGPGWRNSIRHNLSLNDCFIKAGRSANGKGHYWAIHPANIEDFKKGDFRRRKAQRKVRKHMGLSVPDDDDSPTPTPPPPPPPQPAPQQQPPPGHLQDHVPLEHHDLGSLLCSPRESAAHKILPPRSTSMVISGGFLPSTKLSLITTTGSRKRQFDMESLLAPDPIQVDISRHSPSVHVDRDDSPRLESNRSFTTSPSLDSPEQTTVHLLSDKDKSLNEGDQKEESDKQEPEFDCPQLVLHKSSERSEKDAPETTISSNSAMRRAMQWTMSLPLQNMGLHHRMPFASVPGLPFSTSSSPCWSPAQAASLLSYTVGSSANSANFRSSDLSANSSSVCNAAAAAAAAMTNPLVHRWQETLNRVPLDSDASATKTINQ